MLDPWTNNFFNITSIPSRLGPGDVGVTGGGNCALVGPRFHGKLPRGVKLVRSPYDRLWIAGRTFVRGSSDLPNVHRIQNQYSIAPLSKFGTRFTFRPPGQRGKTFEATIPGTQPGEDPLQFFTALGRELLKFPLPGAHRPKLAKLKQIDVGAGLNPAVSHLSAATLQGLRDAVTQGHIKLLLALRSTSRISQVGRTLKAGHGCNLLLIHQCAKDQTSNIWSMRARPSR